MLTEPTARPSLLAHRVLPRCSPGAGVPLPAPDPEEAGVLPASEPDEDDAEGAPPDGDGVEGLPAEGEGLEVAPLAAGGEDGDAAGGDDCVPPSGLPLPAVGPPPFGDDPQPQTSTAAATTSHGARMVHLRPLTLIVKTNERSALWRDTDEGAGG